jgi:hypothetical protein
MHVPMHACLHAAHLAQFDGQVLQPSAARMRSSVLAERCFHRLKRAQRKRVQPHQTTQESVQALDLLLGRERVRAVEAPEPAISLLAQLNAQSTHRLLVGSVEQREEVVLQQRAVLCRAW